MSSSTQPTSAQPGDAASSTPETATERLTPLAPSADASMATPMDTAAPAASSDPVALSENATEASSQRDAAQAQGDHAESAESPEIPEIPESDDEAGQVSPPESGGKSGGKSGSKASGEGGRVDVPAVAAALKELFPALFSGQAKPVKLRIQADIQQRAPGKFSKQQLSAFLRRYTGGTGYLIGLTKAKQRFDLDGQPAGEITDEHRQAAQEELTRRRGITETRRADEERGRQERAQLLRDFSRTTLTPANFCALKGLTQEQLDAQLALAREEATQQPVRDERPPRGDDRRPQGHGRPDGGRGGERRGDRPHGGGGGAGRGGERRADGAPRPARADGQARPEGGRRPPRRNNNGA
ncbi:ProQ/FINO family protein [Roseateles sp. SL47]|uniref:ProQ/FINO family protein n=1 Tax=Roseateles sp. SL47 TaxID=2995138 RepID=UPI00226EEDFF|nr:ProQ/FINO family protein [Roseateles sp. SL47]WAC73618.1 ProQ/FINO family protein [Roseateles sp. SL47]